MAKIENDMLFQLLASGSGSGSSGGGGSSVAPAAVEDNDVNFIDYDGSLLYAYTRADFLKLSEMPENPTHDGLIAQGWNWSLDKAKDYVRKYRKHYIGQMYVTDDGKTRVRLNIIDDSYKSISINLHVVNEGDVTIDWGDGTSHGMTRGNPDEDVMFDHEYKEFGTYDVTISLSDGCEVTLGKTGYTEHSFVYPSGTEYGSAPYLVQDIKIGRGIVGSTSTGSISDSYALNTMNFTKDFKIFNDGELFMRLASLYGIVIPRGAVLPAIMYMGGGMLKRSSFGEDVSCDHYYGIMMNCDKAPYFKGLCPPDIKYQEAPRLMQCHGVTYYIIPESLESVNIELSSDNPIREIYATFAEPDDVLVNIYTWEFPKALITIYVPYSEDHSVLNKYKLAQGWSEWADRIVELPQD